jgi:hypothetical protein
VDRTRFFVTGLACRDGTPKGKCVIGNRVGVVAAQSAARTWENVPDSIRTAAAIALWEATDDAGETWVLVSSEAFVRAALRVAHAGDAGTPFETAKNLELVDNWWVDDELPKEEFFLLCRSSSFDLG